MDKKDKTIQCHQCKTNECLEMYPNGMPDYCHAQNFKDVIEDSKKQYLKPEILKLHLATAKLLKRGQFDWTRIQQCIEFAREIGAARVGLAVCIGLIREGREFAGFLSKAGFEVISIACMVGGVKGKETGIPDELLMTKGITCNPVGQAEILNREGTQLNFIYGLCVGHDTIFIKYSKAPVTYVVAKDTVTGNNPSAVLFSPYHRMKLDKLYGKDAIYSNFQEPITKK